MAYQIPYHRNPGFRPVNDLIPGNATSDNPLEFDLAPAWGPDLARIRSIIHASLGLTQGAEWGDDIQRSVIASFEHGAAAFVNTVEAVRGLTVPAAMAFRAGLITEQDYPTLPGTKTLDHQAQVAVRTGLAFSRICGAVPAMAIHVAMQIAEISAKSEAVQDPRFFGQPSGSGGTVTRQRKRSAARAASRTSRRRETAASGGTKPGA